MTTQSATSAATHPTALRCEYRCDPLGVDVARPRLSWVPGAEGRGQVQTGYHIQVASSPEALERESPDVWDSGRVESAETAHVEYSGRSLESGTRCFWKVRTWDRDGRASPWSEVAHWSVGLLDPDEWVSDWIGHDAPYDHIVALGRAPVIDTNFGMAAPAPIRLARRVVHWMLGGRQREPGRLLRWVIERVLKPVLGRMFLKRMSSSPVVLAPCPHLRKSFALEGTPSRAVLYASALGAYDLLVNGARVTDDYLAPGWSDYERRVYYRAYDVGPLLREGKNVLAAVLADAWFAGYLGPARRRNHYGSSPRLRLELHLEHDDGSASVVPTDGSWRAAAGAHLEADIQMGETYDARLEPRGWSEPGFDDTAWRPVDTGAPCAPRMQWAPHEAVRRRRCVTPVSVSILRPGVQLVDLGENIAGWARLTVDAPAGTAVELRFGERLDTDGSLYVRNLRGARATDTYICAGDGPVTWEPRFTYHGFQYIEVSGYPGELDAGAIVGVAISSLDHDFDAFSCSSPMVTTLFRNIVRTQEANFIEVPTDCPQRDERLGWLGDAQIFARTATFNADVAAFFTKWMADVEDAREATGGYTDFAPTGRWRREGSPAWADAGVICPWVLYQVYEDRRLLEAHYPGMRAWVEKLDSLNPHHLWLEHVGSNNGEWLEVDAETPKDVFATAYYARTVSLVSRIARLLGHEADAERFERLAQSIAAAFVSEYVGPGGRIQGDTQCCYVLALAFDLLDGERRDAAIERLVADLEARDGRPTTGFFGTGYLAPVLTKIGRVDAAYRVLTSEEFPSWGYSIRQGATSIWERWDGWTERKGFQNPLMNSFSHYGFGAIGEWLLTTVCGIDTDGPGYRRLRIQPRPGGGIDAARGCYRSLRGTIAVAWERDEERFSLDVTIPVNTTATVVLPCAPTWRIEESGEPVEAAEGVQVLERGETVTTLALGSGQYELRCHGTDKLTS